MGLELFRTFLAWSLILPASFGLGVFFQPLVRSLPRFLQGICFLAMGFAALSYSIWLLSFLKILNPMSVWILLVASALIFLPKRRLLADWLREAAQNLFLYEKTFAALILNAFFAISFMALLLGSLSPEIGGDALAYQLNLPKDFLREGSIWPMFYDYNSYFPLFMNNLYLIGLATGGVFAAKLFHFVTGFLLFLLLRSSLEKWTQHSHLSFFLSLVLWLTPTLYNTVSTTYIDVALAFYTCLSLMVFFEALDQSERELFLTSGLLMGCAVAMKYLGLMSVVGLGMVWLAEMIQKRELRKHLPWMLIWSAGFLLVAAYWPVRNAWITGNPFFPYFGHIFGTFERPPTDHHALGMGRSVWAFASLFWNMLLSPTSFGAFTARIGPFYFLLTPFMILGAAFDHNARRAMIFSLTFIFCWFMLAQSDRWLIPALPITLFAAALGLRWLYDFASSSMKTLLRRIALLGILLLAVDVLAGVYHYRFSYLLYLGKWSPEEYVRKLERTAPIAFWINQNLPSDAVILVESEPRRFYLKRETLGEPFLRWRTHYDERKYTVDDLATFLKGHSVTHALLSYPVPERKGYWDETLVRKMVRSPLGQEIRREKSENIRDEKYQYILYKLN